jgi:hypothetical protein
MYTSASPLEAFTRVPNHTAMRANSANRENDTLDPSNDFTGLEKVHSQEDLTRAAIISPPMPKTHEV